MNFFKISFLSLPIFLILISVSNAYKPVVLVHGILSDAASMNPIKEQIQLVRSFFHRYLIIFEYLWKIALFFNSNTQERKSTSSTNSTIGNRSNTLQVKSSHFSLTLTKFSKSIQKVFTCSATVKVVFQPAHLSNSTKTTTLNG